MPRPSFRTYQELPITVQHAWQGYQAVDLALERLEQGNFLDAALLADAIYTDDRVNGCMQTRINGLFGLPMEFRYPGQAEARASAKPAADGLPTKDVGDGGDDAQALELKQRIAELARLNWSKMFPGAAVREQMRWALLLNAGLGELVWDWGKDGLLWPTLKTWNMQFVYWRWDTRSYWLIHQEGQTQVRPGDGRWMMLAPFGHNHGWLYGLIRSLGKLWLDRQYALRDWARASEKYSLGIVKAKCPTDASADDKSRFERAVTNLASESTVLLPQGKKTDESSFDLEMMQTDTAVNHQAFESHFKHLDTCIAVLTLGQNLTTDVQSGSRAAAQVHDSIRGDFLKADDEIWATTVRTQVLTYWVRYNWGDLIEEMGRTVEEFVPEVTHEVEPADDLEKKSKVLLNVAQAIPGLAGTEADIHAVLEDHGIPVVDSRELEGGPAPGADANERPPPPPPDSDGTGVEVEQHRLRRLGVGAKPGQRKGRAVVDEVVDAAKVAASKALAERRKALMQICMTSQDMDEMREKLKSLYSDAKPSELRGIIEKALVMAELLGRLSASVDHKHD